LKILIHRGSKEIGGTCIQLSTDKTTILLDLGLPLSNKSQGINLSNTKIDAVLISHSHQDHFGLIDTIGPSIPIYIGELGKHLIDATRMLLGKELNNNNFSYFKSWQSFQIGDFTIKPYLADHSAIDAYGFLIEAEGKRVFYSGDFRAHGRKSILFDKIVHDPPKNIDLLFMEGTMMQRSNDDFPTETAVEKKIYETIKDQNNISFLISSSQNIDRIVSAYRACLKARKMLIIDIYTAWVLEQVKLSSQHVPTIEWNAIGVYADFNQDKKLKENSGFFGDFRKKVYDHRIKKEQIAENPAGFLYLSKMSKSTTMNIYKKETPINVIYSQWLGYLQFKNSEYFGAEDIAAFRNDPQVHFIYAHTSGHATVKDLKDFANALNPKQLIPVHTEFSGKFKEHFDNVHVVDDNQSLDI
jgi:ribonuclease J